MQNLIIVGNGFDKHHKMKTSYLDYRNFLLSHGKKDVVDYFEKGCDFEDREYLWNRMESALGLLAYESAYSFLIDYGSDEWKDSANHDFQYEITTMTKYWPDIKDYLPFWIREIQYGEPDEKLYPLIIKASLFLSFNYTNTLEYLYKIQKEKIVYIHGDASQTNDLVLGHTHRTYYPEWDITDPSCDIRLIEADEIMEQHRKNTLKHVQKIINQNKIFFSSLENTDKIFVLGLSYNDIDKPYLKKICTICPNAKWYFNWYDDADFKNIDAYALSIGVKDYEKIKISSSDFNSENYL